MVSLAPKVLGELLSLGNTAQDLYERCSKASDEFKEAKAELLALHTALSHLEFLTKTPIFNANAGPSSSNTQQTIEAGPEKGLLPPPPVEGIDASGDAGDEMAKVVEVKGGEEAALVTQNNETGLSTKAFVDGSGHRASDQWPDDSFLPQKTREDIQSLAIGCKGVLMDFDKLLTDHKAMEKARENSRLWKPGTILDRYRFSNRMAEVTALRSKLTYHTAAITMMLTVLGSSSLGRIEDSLSKLTSMMAQAAVERQRPINNTAVFINSPNFQHLSPKEQARLLEGDPGMLSLPSKRQPDMFGLAQGKPKAGGGGGGSHSAKMVDWGKGERHLTSSWKTGRPSSSGSHSFFGRSFSTGVSRKAKGREMALVRSRTVPPGKIKEDEESPSKKKRGDWGGSYLVEGWDRPKREKGERNGVPGKEKHNSRAKKKVEDESEDTGEEGPPIRGEREKEKERQKENLTEDKEKEKNRTKKITRSTAAPSTPVKEKRKSDWGESYFLTSWEKSRPSAIKSKSDSRVPTTRARVRQGESKSKIRRGTEAEGKKDKEKEKVSATKKPSSRDKDKEGESKEDKEKRRAERRAKKEKEGKEKEESEANGASADAGGEAAEGNEKAVEGENNDAEPAAEELQFDLDKHDGGSEEDAKEGETKEENQDAPVPLEEQPPAEEAPKEDSEPKMETNVEVKAEEGVDNGDWAGEKKVKVKERKSRSGKDKTKDKYDNRKEKLEQHGDSQKKHRAKSRHTSDTREKEKEKEKDKSPKTREAGKDDNSIRSSTKSAGSRSATAATPRKGKDNDKDKDKDKDKKHAHRASREVKTTRRTRSMSPTKRRGGIFDLEILKEDGKDIDVEKPSTGNGNGLKNKAAMAMVKLALGEGALKNGKEKRRDKEKGKEKERERQRERGRAKEKDKDRDR